MCIMSRAGSGFGISNARPFIVERARAHSFVLLESRAPRAGHTESKRAIEKEIEANLRVEPLVGRAMAS